MTTSSTENSNMERLIRILSIDGGGVRGIIPARILVDLERKLQQRTANEDARIADFFDLVAGTSVGGLLTCFYLLPETETQRPRYSSQEAVDLFLDHSQDIFSIPLYHRLSSATGFLDEKYPDTGLRQVLDKYLRDRYLSDLLKPCLVTAYDIRRRRAVLFTSHDAVRRPSKDFRLVDVTRAATAAPTFFEVAYIKSRTNVSYPLVDGGVFANNPTLCAYAEARTHFGGRAADMAVLSVGTGNVRKPYSYEDAKDWGAVGWMRPLLDIMSSGGSETVDYECRLAFDAVESPEQYLRIDVDLDRLPPKTTSELDNAAPENLAGLCELGAEAAENMSKQLDAFVDMLVKIGAAKAQAEIRSDSSNTS